jgi:hypothetical protein
MLWTLNVGKRVNLTQVVMRALQLFDFDVLSGERNSL